MSMHLTCGGAGVVMASDLVSYHTLALMHRVLRHVEPEELTTMHHKCVDLRDRETRQGRMLRV